MRNNNNIKARQKLRYSYKKICAVKLRRTFQRFIERKVVQAPSLSPDPRRRYEKQRVKLIVAFTRRYFPKPLFYFSFLFMDEIIAFSFVFSLAFYHL